MRTTRQITDISRLAAYRGAWRDLLQQTPGASFFQSLEWLEAYWKHYGRGKCLRVLVVEDDGRPTGIVPLVVQTEHTRAGRLRVLTYPLDNWGSFYGPIGPRPAETLAAGLEHLQHSPRDWEFLELRGSGGLAASDAIVAEAFCEVGLPAYRSLWGTTALVDLSHGWDSYIRSRKRIWLRRLRQAEAKLKRDASLEYIRYRPAGTTAGDNKPRWDYFGVCQALAERSWQASSNDGTTLCHHAVRAFLHEVHTIAAAEGVADINLLLLDGRPAAFIYGYHYRGCVFGLRRGFDASLSRTGVGNLLLWRTLEDSARRGDIVYDMGPGSLESKRHFQTQLAPIYRHSHFPATALRAQLLRIRRWWDSRRLARI
jgi:hypothetical protein